MTCWFRKAVGLVGLALALSACKTPQSVTELSDQAVVDNFRTIVFFREFDPGVNHPLTRWEKPISYAFVGEITERQRNELDAHLADLTRLTNRAFYETDPETASLVAILAPDAFERAVDTYDDTYRRFFTNDDVMREMTAEMHEVAQCFGRIETDRRTGELEQAVVVIPTEVDRFLVRACIIEELTQVMGPVNDSDEIRPSIFNDSSGNLLLSDHDELILQILYDDRLQAGMTWEEAEPHVHEIVADLRN
ncbi:MAG: DUF2927 domain-containing protein [Rhodospirillaceae bacterium]|nr:DUF2927 domain-containing protein [Rhodospirillaceae bacterium]MBT6203537.1 DUF2927 domain-containing protein [Rhodospirillaceae bacterium]MBT7614528.1 DUF2927 domain-containing protein [Rhodospirillaceae bacterium]MBT7646388.1 DUF2927 domain-containing protein [Rhodospirillaceae bacterium]